MHYRLTKEEIEDLQRKAAAWGVRTLVEGLKPSSDEDRKMLEHFTWFASGLDNPYAQVPPFPTDLHEE